MARGAAPRPCALPRSYIGPHGARGRGARPRARAANGREAQEMAGRGGGGGRARDRSDRGRGAVCVIDWLHRHTRKRAGACV